MYQTLAQCQENGLDFQLRKVAIDGRSEYELTINGVFIMASYNHLSSELLIRSAPKYLHTDQDVHILIGGLGMGFTVNEACSLRSAAKIDVVEKHSAVVNWNQQHLAECNQCCLDDPRVQVILSDFYTYILDTEQKYHLICMDIDNGPMMLVEENNLRVYNREFFQKVQQHLCTGGVFAVWSCNPDPELEKELASVFTDCTVEEVYEIHQGEEVPYYLYFAG